MPKHKNDIQKLNLKPVKELFGKAWRAPNAALRAR